MYLLPLLAFIVIVGKSVYILCKSIYTESHMIFLFLKSMFRRVLTALFEIVPYKSENKNLSPLNLFTLYLISESVIKLHKL